MSSHIPDGVAAAGSVAAIPEADDVSEQQLAEEGAAAVLQFLETARRLQLPADASKERCLEPTRKLNRAAAEAARLLLSAVARRKSGDAAQLLHDFAGFYVRRCGADYNIAAARAALAAQRVDVLLLAAASAAPQPLRAVAFDAYVACLLDDDARLPTGFIAIERAAELAYARECFLAAQRIGKRAYDNAWALAESAAANLGDADGASGFQVLPFLDTIPAILGTERAKLSKIIDSFGRNIFQGPREVVDGMNRRLTTTDATRRQVYVSSASRALCDGEDAACSGASKCRCRTCYYNRDADSNLSYLEATAHDRAPHWQAPVFDVVADVVNAASHVVRCLPGSRLPPRSTALLDSSAGDVKQGGHVDNLDEPDGGAHGLSALLNAHPSNNAYLDIVLGSHRLLRKDGAAFAGLDAPRFTRVTIPPMHWALFDADAVHRGCEYSAVEAGWRIHVYYDLAAHKRAAHDGVLFPCDFGVNGLKASGDYFKQAE